MDNKFKSIPKRQRIKLFVETFEKCNISFQDIVDEYNRIRKQKNKEDQMKSVSKALILAEGKL